MVDNAPVTVALRRDILEDVFPAGSRLVEADLCIKYGASRATIRAALAQLASEDLIDREANRGATVRRVSVEEAIEITEARSALEGLIASRAARNATDDERAELVEIGAEMRQAVESGDVVRYGQLNTRLHDALRVAGRHHEANLLVSNLRNRAVHHQFRLAMVPGRPGESLGQHEAIIAAVVAGDEAAARDAMVAHLVSVADVLRRWTDITPS
jgi:DNA-binding GntR family transcriptional regulator